MEGGARLDWENALVDPNTRQGKRTPVTLKIKFKSETLEQFIERYAVDVSQGGIFIRTKEPLAVGTQMRFEFQLRDASPLIAGEGTVVWTRENDPSRPAIAPGMGVRFDRLAEGSQGVLERILSEKAKQAPSRPATEATKPPMFTDTPTRVAPLPVQEALLGGENRSSDRKRADSFGDQGTPLPRPMPFHSDAEDFDEQAFEEATKVRALDELIAQSAGLDSKAADDRSSRRPGRSDATVSDPPRAETATAVDVRPAVVDRDSAPGLPSPPEASRPQPRLLDTTPSPRAEAASAPVASALASASSGMLDAKTRLGVEPAPAKAAVRPTPAPIVAKDAPTKPTGMRAVAHEASAKMPAATSSSSAPLVILLLLLVAAGGAAVWYFVLRPKATEEVATVRPPDTGSGSAIGNGSAGSAVASINNGSAGSGSAEMVGSGSAAAMTGSGSGVTTPAAELVETVIAASVEKATVEILGTSLTGEAPLKAKLEKGKPYKARVQAPGFAMLELELKGGDAKTTAKLLPKPRMISVTSEPPGAVIFIDAASTGKTTPSTIELTKAQAAKKNVRVGLRKSNYKSIERVVDSAKYTEDATQMIARLDESLSVQVPITNNNTGNNNTTNNNTTVVKPNTGSGSATGSAGVTTGSAGSGSAVKPAGTGSGSAVPAGAGSGSAIKPPGTGSGSAAVVKPPGTGSGSAVVKPPGTGSGSATPGAGSGSAVKPPTGTGSGSAVKPPGTGSGSATGTTPILKDGLKPATGTGSASTSPSPIKDGPKEPEPDFMKKP